MSLRQKIIQACNQPTFTQGYDALEKVVKDEVKEFAEELKKGRTLLADNKSFIISIDLIDKLLKEYQEGKI